MIRRSGIATGIIIFMLGYMPQAFSQAALVAQIIDTNYLQIDTTGWSIRVYSISKVNRIYLTSKSLDNTVSFLPERKVALGLGFSYRSFALDLALPVFFVSPDSNQHTTGFNLLSSIYRRQHNIDIFFQASEGFAAKQNIDGVEKSITRPDLRTLLFGLNYNYLFNYRRFSFNPAFIGTQIQKRSAGSPLLGFFISTVNISSNDTIVPPSSAPEFNDSALFSSANIFSVGITGGYAYTLVLPYHFFISGALTPGIAFSRGILTMDSVREFGEPFTVSPKLITRASLGFAGKRFYALLLYHIDLSFVNLGDNNHLIYTPEKIKLVAGLRFK